MNQTSQNLAGNLDGTNPSNTFVQQNRFATPVSVTQVIQGNSNVQPNFQGQQYLSPNPPPKTFAPTSQGSYPSQPGNPAQYGTLQNNIQRIIGAPGTQTSIQSTHSRNIENQFARIPQNISTTHLIDNQHPANFNGSSKI